MKRDRLYSILLRLYPSIFREEYEREMHAAFRRRLRDQPGRVRRAALWISAITDVLATAPGEHVDMLINDIRYSLRTLRKTPAFTTAALMTLALGIGATTAIYSLVHTVLLRPLPFTEPDRMVRIWDVNAPLRIPEFSSSLLNFVSWEEQSRSFDALAAIRNASVNLTGDGEPQRVRAAAVTERFWSLTGIAPIAGRVFSPEEHRLGKDTVVMLSEGLWRQRHGGDSAVIGRTILVNGTPHVVVGIAPQDVGYTTHVELWSPLAMNAVEENRGNHVVTVLGKLRAGVGLSAADAELNVIAARLEKDFPRTNAGWRVRLIPITDWIVDANARASLYVLFAAVALLLLTACANVAGLLVTRSTARAHEFSVRLALGAGGGRLARQLTTESLVLALFGGVLGVVTAVAIVTWLAPRVANQMPRTMGLAVDWPVLVFALALTGGVGLLFGAAPSWHARRAQALSALRHGARGITGIGGTRLRLALVGMQVAMATILITGALLLIQSLARLQRVDVGFQPDHVLTASINLPQSKYPTGESAEAFYKRVTAEVQAQAGVDAVGITSGIPMGGSFTSMPIVPVERPPDVPEQGFQAFWRSADAGYFRAIGIPLLHGRIFDDRNVDPPSIVLSARLARRLWPDGSDPIGRLVRLGNARVFAVVGVVGDIRLTDRRDDPMPAMYFRPFLLSNLTLAIRTTGDPSNMVGALRAIVQRIDPAQPLFDIRTMEGVLDENAARSRLHTTLLTAFACLALLLGVVGVAGVVTFSVERRTPDLALRVVLGATPVAAMRNAAGGGMVASLMGLVLGLIGAWALGQRLSSVLFQTPANDVATFAGVAAAMMTVAALACWIPARRAARIDPAVALR